MATVLSKLLVAAALILICARSSHAQQPATLTHNSNLRSTASTSKTPIETLPAGSSVTLLSTPKTNGYDEVQAPDGKQGWVLAKNVKVVGVGASSTALKKTTKAGASLPAVEPVPGTEAVDDPACPAEGTTKLTGARKTDDELRNRAKRFVAQLSTAVLLSIDDLKALQADTDTNAAHAIQAFVPRDLTNKRAGVHTVSEGERVSVTGYLHRAENGSVAESVNCAGADGRDIHLNLNAPKPSPPTFNEWTGIVVEVIPQAPLPGWTQADRPAVLAALQAVRDAALPVLAIGSLTYDNEHEVNADKSHPVGTNPKRVSLWEIHPVLEFYVCPKAATCDPATPHTTWLTLKDWRTQNPH